MPLGRNIHLHFQSICLRYRLQQPSFFLKICNNCQQMPPLICFSQSAPTVVRQFKRNLSYLRSGLPKEIIRDTVCACIVRMQFSLQFRFPFPPAPCGLFYLACHHQCRAASPGRRPRRAVSAVSMAFPAKKILRSRPNIIRKHSRRVKLLWHQIPVSALSRHERSRWLLYQAQHDTMRRTAGTSRLRPGMCPGLRFAFLADLSAQMGPPITVPGSCILLSARLVRAFYWPAIISAGRPFPVDGPLGRFGCYARSCGKRSSQYSCSAASNVLCTRIP